VASAQPTSVPAAPRLRVALNEKRFGQKRVLGRIAFEVEAGEILAVLGASGAGKSTLLRTIAGLDRNWHGSIEIAAANPSRAAVIGVVYQEPRLMPWLTVEQNIALAAGVTPADAGLQHLLTGLKNASIDGLLHEVCLEEARHYLPKQLSGGMAQRVAIARALLRAPDVLLLDEPFSALDVLTRRRLIALTREVTKRHQTATVIVTHDPDEAVRLADRVIVLAHSYEGGVASDAWGATPSGATPSGATVCADFRPSSEPAAMMREVEGIIATLQESHPTRVQVSPI
jgi:sulfonate transport system ATP-binding protein